MLDREAMPAHAATRKIRQRQKCGLVCGMTFETDGDHLSGSPHGLLFLGWLVWTVIEADIDFGKIARTARNCHISLGKQELC
jgi:hypothetical protein